MQRTFSKEFKFKVAIEAIRGDLTIAEIISKYQVSKTAIHEWKRLILENGSSIFGQKKDISPEKQVEQLHRIIGKLYCAPNLDQRRLKFGVHYTIYVVNSNSLTTPARLAIASLSVSS